MVFLSRNEKDTKKIIKKLVLDNDDINCFFLLGTLGVGKTLIANCILKEKKIESTTLSPTFLSKIEEDNFSHYDLYLKKKINMSYIYNQIQYDLERKKVVIVEWADRLKISKYSNLIRIDISFYNSNEYNRKIITTIIN